MPERSGSKEAGKPTVLDWLSRRLRLTEIFSLLSSYGFYPAEVDTRKPLAEALSEAGSKPWPSYARWPRVLSLIVIALLMVEFITGSLMALYYLPTPESAYASTGAILREVDFGQLIRQIHFWGAQALLFVLIARVVRLFARRAYGPPRELLWVFAVLLMFVGFHLELTGRALPMTASGYWSAVRALEIVQSVPILGPATLSVLGADGTFISDVALIRFYLLHAAVLPLLAVALVYLHFSTLRTVGISARSTEQLVPGDSASRLHLANIAILLHVALGVLISLAVLATIPFDPPADPTVTVPGIGPPWYLLAPFGFLEWTANVLPRWAGGLVLFLGFALFVSLPSWDRSPKRSRTMSALLASVFLVLWLALSWYGARVA